MATTDQARRERRVTLGRQLEGLPSALFGLLLVTVAVVVLAVFFGFRGHTAQDGTDCGAVFAPMAIGSIEAQKGGCDQVLADASLLALAFGLLAVPMVLICMVTLIVRGWSRREPAPWPGA